MENYPQDHPARHSYESVISAAIAAVLVIGVLWGLIELSQSRGASSETLTTAEHACAILPYARQRQACIKQWAQTERPTED